MQNVKQAIKLENDYPDAWICICGNTPSDYGFYPCDNKGEEVEPIDDEWDGDLYVCSKCLVIISTESYRKYGLFEIVGKA